MIASMAMYARPQNRGAYDRFWSHVRTALQEAGAPAPATLDHDIAHDAIWDRPDLVLAQICNLPYRASYRDKVHLLGAAHYDVPDTPAGFYRSYFVVRQDDAAETIRDCAQHRLAVNDLRSQSGWGAAYANARNAGILLTPHTVTGSHQSSMAAVACGRADLACVDAVCWQMDRASATAAKLRLIGQTHATPGQSFITRHANPRLVYAAIEQAIAQMPDADRALTGLCGITKLPESAYDLPFPPMMPETLAKIA